MAPSLKSIPRLPRLAYKNKINSDYLLVFNLLSARKIAVLNKEAAFLYEMVNNKRNMEEILRQAQIEDSKTNFSDLKKIFQEFRRADIVFWRPRRRLPKNGDVKRLAVWLHITNQCNLRCRYCYIKKTPEKMSAKIGNSALEAVFRSAVKNGIKVIKFKFSGGEAMLEFNLMIGLVKRAWQLGGRYGIRTKFVVLTNGVLVTEEVARVLRLYRLKVAVSLDGLGRYHDENRIFPEGDGSFRQTMQGIESLWKYKVPFNVSVTITNKNIEGLPLLTRWLLKKTIPFSFNLYRENTYSEIDNRVENERLIYWLGKAYCEIEKNLPRYSLVGGLLDLVSFSGPRFGNPCGMGKNYLIIRHDGKIFSCQNLINSGRPIGTIDDGDLLEIMQKGDFTKGIKIEDKIGCRNCQWRYICAGGCPLLSLRTKGSFRLPSPYCSVYRTLIPRVLAIEAKRIIKFGG